jgi:hypothetical protein
VTSGQATKRARFVSPRHYERLRRQLLEECHRLINDVHYQREIKAALAVLAEPWSHASSIHRARRGVLLDWRTGVTKCITIWGIRTCEQTAVVAMLAFAACMVVFRNIVWFAEHW